MCVCIYATRANDCVVSDAYLYAVRISISLFEGKPISTLLERGKELEIFFFSLPRNHGSPREFREVPRWKPNKGFKWTRKCEKLKRRTWCNSDCDSTISNPICRRKRLHLSSRDNCYSQTDSFLQRTFARWNSRRGFLHKIAKLIKTTNGTRDKESTQSAKLSV